MVYNIFIFRRDLRFDDNKALHTLLSYGNVIPIFIFTPEQVGDKNQYRSDPSIQFMVETLKDLEKQAKSHGTKLHIFYGHYLDVISDIIKNNQIEYIGFNEDYSPYSRKRDKEIYELAKKHNISHIIGSDLLLSDSIDSVLTNEGKPYSKYTPFYKKSMIIHKKTPPVKPFSVGKSGFSSSKLTGMKKWEYSLKKAEKLYDYNPDIVEKGGRKEGLKILSKIKEFNDYNKERNNPNRYTTRLSAHMKFGTISARHFYWTISDKLGDKSELIKQIYWRDFYMYMLWYNPDIIKGSASRQEMRLIKWSYNEKDYQAWCDGKTGIPIVDAGMREMNATGFMHNRLRMIVATFLIYNLGIDWQLGEKYFARKLVDADWSNNRGNWQWTAGIEKWSNDYFRALAMPSQVARFDPKAEYIKRWCPELKSVEPRDLVDWDIKWVKYPELKGIYPEPVVDDLKKSRLDGIERIKQAIKKYKN